ncbi:hypothetical protein EXIGLDRAFT_725631 [Exidia glandulosa HHB12029]|uniref:Chitin-binding type-3 domain-containing protein n=1 Tax=Exidia glandulosa HHB12029 TaxID=1314781 RepID=A0A165Q6P0_EXIGL|nr:hypothetical protein EXIGLDRAFT_725631 [Exidia glandulosa HHB12029]
MRSLSHSFVALALAVAAVRAGPISKRAEGDPMGPQENGEATFYDPGMGACGVTNSGSDLMAAVSQAFFDTFPGAGANPNANPLCGKTATVNYNGKTVQVKLLDRCVSCAYVDLDLSPAAFDQLASRDEGRIHGISWQIDGEGGSTPPPPPPETSAPPPPPETTPPPPPPESTPPPPESTPPPPPPPPSSSEAPTSTEDPCPGETETPMPPPPPSSTEDPCPDETETSTPPPPTQTEDPCPGEEPSSTSTPPPPTGNTSGGSCADSFDASKVYVGGDTADYQGHHWKAKWWTQGAAPGADMVWEDAGAC